MPSGESIDFESTLLPSVDEITLTESDSRLESVSLEVALSGDSLTPRVKRLIESYGLVWPIELKLEADTKEHPSIEDSFAYDIDITHSNIQINAATEWGAIAACGTLFRITDGRTTLDPCHIVDQPAYPWRGLMVDTSRHFIPLVRLRETLDLMALYRLNVLHLNLSNDQACRFAPECAPKLAAQEHYTAQELRELVEYASDRGIRIVPELDVPGHTTSWIWAHPEWGAGVLDSPATEFGVHKACIDPTQAKVREAVYEIFTELSNLFPDEYVHVGGDEVESTWWDENPTIQQWMQARDMSTSQELQTWFINDLAKHLTSLGKKVIGWDEVLDEALPEDIVIQAWRGAHAQEYAKQGGHPTIVSAPYYLDLFYPAQLHYCFDPGQSPREVAQAYDSAVSDPRLEHVRNSILAQRDHGDFESLRTGGAGEVLGGEACMWSELVDGDTLHRRVWSRMPAISERFWQGQKAVKPIEMERRLNAGIRQVQEKFKFDFSVTCEQYPFAELAPLFAQLEPVKWYSRLIGAERAQKRLEGAEEAHIARPYQVNTPLDRPVDFLLPECPGYKGFAEDLANGLSVEPWFESWEKQFSAFDACVAREPKLAELKALSHRLMRLSLIGRMQAPIDFDVVKPVGEYMLPVAAQVILKNVHDVAGQWGVSGKIETIERGLINDTFLVDNEIVLQRLNWDIFDTDAVIRNRRKLDDVLSPHVPALISTIEGNDFYESETGEVWRASKYIDSVSVDSLPTESCAGAGQAFGALLSELKRSDYRPEVVIQDFHNFDHYVADLKQAVANNTETLPQWASKAIEMALEYEQQFPEDQFQVIHGDCKINNLLLDKDDHNVLAIVDLDTLMWGHPAWDFGDLLRSVLSGVDDKAERFERISQTVSGFCSAYSIEREMAASFVAAPVHMSLMLGVRFITDHLKSDTYFKVSYRGQNLERAEGQFKLVAQITDEKQELEALIQSAMAQKDTSTTD